ncbi:hypothetical protein Dshi_1907 [Dinoroseobacter shibae DFL 12 = DSM 16493]|jgi:hypothetical protein|uniref:Primase C-terminal 1 domain-containing protein n=1 Tax=Dinoroseobacter shibae (strain DSM 16493 / NCIMB 14021 / DFL 12) TaxID=398580 RepID=A8LND6_DINSH|nr:primase C-terminal domain-containing protein [Dinoroseobacter shibae]ABV93649.1 hypothetical protein Dshi_1907 [Dinoroseobacter shibae DFL 12 = DSM 16493]URF45099.1 primase C-terminal domain-containing protein [Dinoroseobacter shibae]URF49404.1 primase C-terminal domain-containing protein [Dinoroseobacter shibae]
MDELKSKTARAFLNLWNGYENRHLELRSRGVKNENGKVEAKVTTEDGPLTEALAWKHISGETSIGVAPVRADSTCRFGVLDVDWYDMPEDEVLELVKRMRTRCAAFRSKSRGLHIYVFTDQPVRAKLMHDYLASLRRRLPKKVQQKTEIFPKSTQTVVTPDNEPTSINLPLYGSQRELAWVLTDQHMGVIDEADKSVILDMIENGCRVSASTVEEIAREQPTLDHSDMGYKVPDNPAGRNDLLMRIAMSMQSRGWPDTEMDAEIRRLNGDTNFHHLFGDGPLPEAEIANLLKSAKKREKGTPTPLHYRMVEKFNREWAVIDLNGKIEYLRKSAPEFTTYSRDDLMAKTATQRVQYGKGQVPIAKLWIEDPDRAEYEGVVCEPEGYDGPGYNVFRGFKCAPRDGDATVFKEYVLNVLCGGDADLAHWVTMWLADTVQRPTEPSVSTAIALRGPQGAGKSFLQEKVLGSIFHDRQITVVHESSRLFS